MLLAVLLLSACVVTPRVPEERPSPGEAIATFLVAGSEIFNVELPVVGHDHRDRPTRIVILR